MASSHAGKLSIKENGLRSKLLIIEALIFALPFLIVSYFFYRNNVFLKFSQIAIVALTLILVLAGLIILRQIFDRFFMVATLIKKIENGDKGLIEIQQDTTELHEITVSFNNLMKNFEEATSELQGRVFELFSIKELTEVASKTLDIDGLLNLLLEKAMVVSRAQIGSVLMVESEKERFRLVASKVLESGPKKGSYISIDESLARRVVSDKKPLLVQDIETDSRTLKPNDPKYGPPSFLSMPIFLREDVIAVLNLSHKETGQLFDSNDEHILSIMIGEIGFALENATLHSRVEEHLKDLQQRTSDLSKANNQLQQEITERKRAEEALRESEQKYRLLVENAKDGIFIVQDGVVKFPNPVILAISGYSGEELAKIPFVDLIHPEDRDMVLERDKKMLKGEEVPSTYSFRVINRAGEELWVQLNTVPVTWEGRPSTLNFIRDITQQKKLEAQFQRAQKMGAIGTLAGGVAHDLNNILAGLVSYPELLLMEMPKKSPLRKPVLTIQKSGQKAAAIVQDLLTLARRGIPAAEVVDLNHIISEYEKSPEYEKLELNHPEVHVQTNLETSLLPVLGSPAHLSKAVMNLVSNAAEAMPEGGEILISTENRYIDQPIRGYDYIEEGDYVVLWVSDTGAGISTEDMERIFEPFYTKKAMGISGTGLGMAVVWGTVKDHRGYIDIQSTEGKARPPRLSPAERDDGGQGTTFTLYFPATRKELTKDRSLVTIQDYMGKGESILVVDDVEEQREIASRMLQKVGYSVTPVSSGEEAVDYLKDNSADLLVLDMIMDPGIDGLETYRRILQFHPGQKAIIVSGFSETERVKGAQRLGAGAYVKKRFLLEKLGLAVRDELDK